MSRCLSLAPLGLGLMGNVMGKVRRNFYVGFRVPWTLASDASGTRPIAWLPG